LLAFYFIELSRNDDVYSHPLLLSKQSLIRSNFLCFQPLERLVFSRGVGCSMSVTFTTTRRWRGLKGSAEQIHPMR